MSNLILHCGASRVELEQVASAPTPAPSGRWFPIPHILLHDTVVNALHTAGLHVRSAAHALSADKLRYFGLLEIAAQNDAMACIVGLRNSSDRRFRAGLVLGHFVTVCDNLSFGGAVTVARKHTTRIGVDMPSLVSAAIGSLASIWAQQETRFQAYQTTEISDVQAHDLAVRAYDAGAITITQLPTVLTEWRTPRHPEFAEGKTVWRFHNAVTEAAKSGGLWSLPRRTLALQGVLDGQLGLLHAPARN